MSKTTWSFRRNKARAKRNYAEKGHASTNPLINQRRNMIEKIKRLPLREAFKHEALDFTKWLEEDIDVIKDYCFSVKSRFLIIISQLDRFL